MPTALFHTDGKLRGGCDWELRVLEHRPRFPAQQRLRLDHRRPHVDHPPVTPGLSGRDPKSVADVTIPRISGPDSPE